MFTDPEGNPIALPDSDCADDVALLCLQDGELEIIGQMPWSSNGTFLCVVRQDDLALTAIYKPRDTERPLWDFPEGTLWQREIAAYELSEFLGWGIVPATTQRDDPELGPGSIQRFIMHDPNEHFFTLLEGNEDRFRTFAAFDVLANNADRKGGHCLRDARGGRIVGIDQGLTFNAEWKLRTVIWQFGGEPIPEALLADVERIRPDVVRLLQPYLSPFETASTLARVEALLDVGAFPVGTDDYRSYPWPLV